MSRFPQLALASSRMIDASRGRDLYKKSQHDEQHQNPSDHGSPLPQISQQTAQYRRHKLTVLWRGRGKRASLSFCLLCFGQWTLCTPPSRSLPLTALRISSARCPRCRVTRLRPISRLPQISMVSVLALLCFCLVSWTAAAQETDKHHPTAIAPQGAHSTFQTLDGDTQQVNSEEIWRIRATSTSDEPPGAVVIDYAFERVYVEESLDSVVEKVGGVRPLKKFTLPAGGPVYIVATKVTGVTRAIPHLHHPNARAIIVSREGQTQVQETREAINQALVK